MQRGGCATATRGMQPCRRLVFRATGRGARCPGGARAIPSRCDADVPRAPTSRDQRVEEFAEARISPRLPSAESVGIECPACGVRGLGERRSVPDHEYGLAHRACYSRCGACASEFQTPMPDLAALASWYPPAYHSMGGGGRLLEIRHDLRLRRLGRLLDGEGALLDYGCGDGGFLVHASRKLSPRPLYGYEIADRPERIVLADGAVTIIRGSFADLLRELPA